MEILLPDSDPIKSGFIITLVSILLNLVLPPSHAMPLPFQTAGIRHLNAKELGEEDMAAFDKDEWKVEN